MKKNIFISIFAFLLFSFFPNLTFASAGVNVTNYVDCVNGDDATAQYNNASKPFLTLKPAIENIVSNNLANTNSYYTVNIQDDCNFSATNVSANQTINIANWNTNGNTLIIGTSTPSKFWSLTTAGVLAFNITGADYLSPIIIKNGIFKGGDFGYISTNVDGSDVLVTNSKFNVSSYLLDSANNGGNWRLENSLVEINLTGNTIVRLPTVTKNNIINYRSRTGTNNWLFQAHVGCEKIGSNTCQGTIEGNQFNIYPDLSLDKSSFITSLDHRADLVAQFKGNQINYNGPGTATLSKLVNNGLVINNTFTGNWAFDYAADINLYPKFINNTFPSSTIFTSEGGPDRGYGTRVCYQSGRRSRACYTQRNPLYTPAGMRINNINMGLTANAIYKNSTSNANAGWRIAVDLNRDSFISQSEMISDGYCVGTNCSLNNQPTMYIYF